MGGCMKDIDIGIEEKERKNISDGLSRILADTYMLYLQTQNFHWNITGPMFGTLHMISESQYLELGNAVDVIAERIRALGVYVPATITELTELATIKEFKRASTPEKMVELLIDGQESIVKLARIISKVVSTSHDQVTADLLVNRMKVHEKNAWMLRSFLS